MFGPGAQVGAYTIVRQIGAGGMGEVYEARHRHLDRRAAIKVLAPAYSTSEAVINRFFNEAKAASVIHHPGIVEILDCDVHPTTGRAYIVMELLDGEDLGSCIRRIGSFGGAVESGVAISAQIADALSASHAKGITHRDLKPDNVFLARDANGSVGTSVKVLDFGVAKLVAEGRGSVGSTRPGSLLGTPLYMAPEQCRSANRVDHRSDVYSLGCIMFELFAGRTPFQGEGEGELLIAHISEPAPDLQSLAPELDPRLAGLVQSMLAKDPAARPQTMADVVRAIETFLQTDVRELGSMIQIPAGFTRREPSAPAPAPTRSAAPSRKPSPTPVARTMLLPNGQTTLSQSAAEVDAPVSEAPKLRGRSGLVIGGGAVALAAVGAFLFVGRQSASTSNDGKEAVRSKAPSETTTAPANPQPAPAAPISPPATAPAVLEQPPAPKMVTVRLSSVPSGAEVWVGNEAGARGNTPIAISMREGAAATTVVLKAADYLPKSVVIDGSRDAEVSAELQKPKKKKEGQAVPHRHEKSEEGPAYKPVGD